MLALGDIRDRANEFQPSGLIFLRSMPDNMNMLDRTIGHQQPMFKIEISPFLRRTVDGLLEARSIFRMSSLEHELHRRLIGSSAFEYAKGFL